MAELSTKLILIQEGRPDQEFQLNKASVLIGRALTNDIVLEDSRASRTHVRLEIGASGTKLIDLGSSNGTRVNGLKVEKADLNSGDVVGIGSSQLRFEISLPFDEATMTVKYEEEDLEEAYDQDVLPVAINETSLPRLVLFTKERTWEVSLQDVEQLTIGRTEPNQVVIEQTKVSRQHAVIIRKGDSFILRDLGSTNGTWWKGERVSERILQEGDAFRIGNTQIVFKQGFSQASLTMADELLERALTRRPVVFVPGMMGSQLWLGNERIWPNISHIIKNPEILLYPSSMPLEARGIVDEVVIIPNLIKMDQYNRLGDYMVEELGYTREQDFFEFAYDWRQDVRLSASQLAEFIDGFQNHQPVTIIAHSLGTMVSRYYIEHRGGKNRVERIILMGGPHRGAVKVLPALLTSPGILPFGLYGEKTRRISLSFPSSYQIIPPYPCGVDRSERKINFLEDEDWLDEEYRPLLRAGRQFRQELGNSSSVPALSIFGYGLKTVSKIIVNRNPNGRCEDVSTLSEAIGDSSILEQSAVLEGSEIHPVQQYHGSLFVDSDVKMRLKIELAR